MLIFSFGIQSTIFATLLEFFIITTLYSTQNHFIQLASKRTLQIIIFVEISITIITYIFMLSDLLNRVTDITITYDYNLILVIFYSALFLFKHEKVPFDVVEAESELIDGLTTDLPGMVFSMIYSAETALPLLDTKLLLVSEFGFL